MDHELYRYRALKQRPLADVGHIGGKGGIWHPEHEAGRGQVSSPAVGGRAALRAYVVLFLEHWEAEPAPETLRDPRFVGEYGSFKPDYRSWTQREYGLRVGIFRVMDTLREAGIRPVVAANARAVQRLPRLVEILQDMGCEWVGHGLAATELMHSRLSIEEQRAHIRNSLTAVETATGTQVQGWLSQDWGTTPHTCGLLAEAGLRYTLDWCNDDEPYPLLTEPPLWAVPMSAEWDDVQCQWFRHLAPHDHAALALQAFDQLRQECAEGARSAVFGLPVHPWVTGMSSRIGAFKRLLSDLRSRDGVQWCLPSEILNNLPAREASAGMPQPAP